MSNEISLEVMNRQVLSLMQALLGAISPNFRMVMLEYNNEVWRLLFILEQDKPDDRAEIDDISTEFEALQEKGIEYEVIIDITDKDIPWPTHSFTKRVVYRRREN